MKLEKKKISNIELAMYLEKFKESNANNIMINGIMLNAHNKKFIIEKWFNDYILKIVDNNNYNICDILVSNINDIWFKS